MTARGIRKRRARASGVAPTSARTRMSRTMSAGTATPADGEQPEPRCGLVGWWIMAQESLGPMPWIRCPRRSQIRPCSDVPESSRSVEYFLAPQVPVASSASRDGFGVTQASLSETAPARPGALGPQPQTSEESRHASQRRPQAAGPSMPRPSSAPGPAQRRPPDRLGVHGLAEEIHDGHEGRCAPLGTPRAAVRWWCRSRLRLRRL
jgi:hypothetical protein